MRVRGLLVVLVLTGCTGSNAPTPGSDPPPRSARSEGSPPALPPIVSATPKPSASEPAKSTEPPQVLEDPAAQRARIVAAFAGRRPRAWGMAIAGVRTKVPATETAIALTFDACGGPGGDGYDGALIDYLRRERVPATLFVTSKWIAARRGAAAALAADPLFEIENHGSAHRPCSVTGRSAWDIRGTRNAGDAVDEIQRGARAIAELTGRAPRFYRPGTAYFDDVCLDVVAALGEEAAGFAVNGDGGAGSSRTQVRDALVKAPSGAIVLMHMNHPGGQTAEGVMDAVPILRARGVKLVRLGDAIAKER